MLNRWVIDKWMNKLENSKNYRSFIRITKINFNTKIRTNFLILKVTVTFFSYYDYVDYASHYMHIYGHLSHFTLKFQKLLFYADTEYLCFQNKIY